MKNSWYWKTILLVMLVGCFGTVSGDVVLPDPPTDLDFPVRNEAQEELGQFLFFDKILSGNLNISCATCHHPMAGTGDGLSLPVGEGGMGLGITRDTGAGADAVPERVPRNAPHVFNLGAHEFTGMFHDGRVEVDPSQPSGFLNPAGDNFPEGLNNPLSAQAIFPITSGTEMAGQAGENSVGDEAALGNLHGPGGVWEQLVDRLKAIPDYVGLFMGAFDDVNAGDDITITHVGNAIGAFEAAAWRADDHRFNQYLRGDDGALSGNEMEGMMLFYGHADCGSCHSGSFQTDQGFYAIGMPQIGAGKGDGASGHEDYGRERVTGDSADRMRFRVPPLANVTLTAPYGHSGAYDDLESVIRQHTRPRMSLINYDQGNAVLPSRADLDALDFLVMDNPATVGAIKARIEIPVIPLTQEEIDRIIDFLGALTDESSLDMRNTVPAALPSGLPVFD